MKTRTISSKIIYEGRAVTLRLDTVETPDGRRATREIVEHADCVAIVPVDANNNILLVRQYREAVGRDMLEIPAGGIDPGEQPEDAVRREMQEETGFLPGRMERMGGFYSTPGYCREYLHLYAAGDLAPGRLYAEDTQSIVVVPTSTARIPDLIASGQICDAKTIAGLLMYLRSLKT